MPTDGKTQTYGFLEELSTEQLLDLIPADLEPEEDGDDELTFRILEVIEQREKENPTGLLPDVDQAWEKFQKYFLTPDGTDRPLYPVRDSDWEAVEEPVEEPVKRHRKLGRPLRRLLPLVAVLAVAFSSMVVAQAFGVDVFGALARWTEDTFHFTTGEDNDESEALRQVVQGAFDGYGITIPAPAWYPPDTMLACDIKATKDSGSSVVLCEFVCGDESFFIEAHEYIEARRISDYTLEKDGLNVEEYPSNGRLFYIMSNQSNMRAVYSNGQVIMVINGKLSSKNIKQIIDSIGE